MAVDRSEKGDLLEFNYKPSKAEARLLKVLCEPNSRLWTVAKICRVADISRETYYRAFTKQLFTEYHGKLLYDLIKEQSLPLVQTAVIAAKNGSFPHWKALMDMVELQVNHKQEHETVTIRFAEPYKK